MRRRSPLKTQRVNPNYFNSGYLADKLSIDLDMSLIIDRFKQEHDPVSALDVLFKYSRQTLKGSLVDPDLIAVFQLAEANNVVQTDLRLDESDRLIVNRSNRITKVDDIVYASGEPHLRQMSAGDEIREDVLRE